MKKKIVFSFYKMLYQLFTASEFIEVLAREIVRVYSSHKDILSLGGINDIDVLRCQHSDDDHFMGEDFKQKIVESCMKDLSPWFKHKDVCILMLKYSANICGDQLLAYATKVHEMDSGTNGKVAVVTLVVSDWEHFQKHMGPENNGVPYFSAVSSQVLLLTK